MHSKIQSAVKYGKRGLAAYAAYEAHVATAQKLADRFCHTLTIEEDYSTNRHAAAQEVIARSRRGLPGQRRQESVAFDGSLKRAARRDSKGIFKWDWLFVPGLRSPLQIRWGGFDSDMTFRAARRSDLAAFMRLVNEQREAMEDDQPVIDGEDWAGPVSLSIMGWNSKDNAWEVRKSRTARTFSSVVLPAELEAEILADLKAYSESRARMERLEMPWRRGYLLEGPPGTGKTSTALAIAGRLGFNLASLSLTGIESDDMLRQAVSQLKRHTVLVIEDIDAYAISHDREHNTTKDGALSLSGLLNALDGFETPDGLLTIATTNHVDQLDEALVRNGRFDRTFHLGYIQADALERLFKWFYEEEPFEPAPQETALANLSPSAVAETFKQHLDSPAEGWAAINALIYDRTHALPPLHAVA